MFTILNIEEFFKLYKYILLEIILKEYVKNVTFFAETFGENPKMDIYFCPFLKFFEKFVQKCNICD